MFSIVFRAVQETVARDVAIKQIRSDLANLPEFIEQFETEARLFFARELENDWGTTTMAKFETDEGHILVWFASGYREDLLSFEGEVQKGRYAIKGSVKKHDEYEGSPQTVVTHCKVAALEAAS